MSRIRALATAAVVAALAVMLWPFAADGVDRVMSGPVTVDQSQTDGGKRIVKIAIKDGQLVGGPLRAVQNDVLVLQIESDEAEDFHIEGYHAFAKLSPGRTVALEVWTATVGQFPILLDKSKRHVGDLEVVSKPQ